MNGENGIAINLMGWLVALLARLFTDDFPVFNTDTKQLHAHILSAHDLIV